MWVDGEGARDNLDRFARTLADEGPAGVHIALRTGVRALPGKVIGLLNLGKEWSNTEEAKRFLFGEKLDDYALGP